MIKMLLLNDMTLPRLETHWEKGKIDTWFITWNAMSDERCLSLRELTADSCDGLPIWEDFRAFSGGFLTNCRRDGVKMARLRCFLPPSHRAL